MRIKGARLYCIESNSAVPFPYSTRYRDWHVTGDAVSDTNERSFTEQQQLQLQDCSSNVKSMNDAAPFKTSECSHCIYPNIRLLRISPSIYICVQYKLEPIVEASLGSFPKVQQLR